MMMLLFLDLRAGSGLRVLFCSLLLIWQIAGRERVIILRFHRRAPKAKLRILLALQLEA